MRRRVAQAAVFLAFVFLTSSSALVFEGGISNLGGIQLQEELFLERAKSRGKFPFSQLSPDTLSLARDFIEREDEDNG